MNNQSAINTINEFDLIIKELIGIYLDSLMGFQLTVQSVEKTRDNLIVEKGMNIEQINLFPFRHTSLFSERIHEETVGQFITRMSTNGKNSVFAANMYLISVFNYWEDHYRKACAQALKVDKNDLKSDIMGDLRLLRNSIVHHKAIALKDIEKCKLLTFFKENDQIKLTRDNIIFITDHIKNYIAKLKSDASKIEVINYTDHYGIAIILSKTANDKELAQYHFKEAISISQDFTEAYVDYANLLYEKFNNLEDADMYYKKAISLNPKNMLARSNYAAFLSMINKTNEAQNNFNIALEIDPNHVTTNYNYGLLLKRSLKEFDKAKYHLEKALESEPLNHEILLQYADILKTNLKDYDKAEIYYRKTIEINMDYAEGHNDFGVFLMENRSDITSAEQEFKKALELNVNYAEAYYNYGNLLFIHTPPDVENLEKARKFYLRAIEINKNYKSAYMNLAILLTYSFEEVDLGINYLKAAIKLDPLDDQLLDNLASIYKDKKGDSQQAYKLYMDAITLNPKNDLAHINFSQLLGYNLGKIDNARTHYLIAISLNNNLVNRQMEVDFGLAG